MILKNNSKQLYKPFISKAKNKKYSVYVIRNGKKKLINFGAIRKNGIPYPQYFDKLGHYSKYNHLDKNRRRLYYKRFGKTNDKNSAKYWSHKILW